jgi:proteasome lid subunit RPN8/RPN11
VPTLRFTPYAWAKLLFLRDRGDTEVGGFGVSGEDGDLFLVEDVRLVRQRCTQVSVEFDDEAVADYFDEQVDSARQPEQFARIWLHSHPGDSAEPSATDEQTFERAFGGSDWAVMVIIAKGGETYARLRFGCGPGAELVVPVAVDWAVPFPEADHVAWRREYDQCVRPIIRPIVPYSPRSPQHLSPEEIAFLEEHPELLDEWEAIPHGNELNDLERSVYDGYDHDGSDHNGYDSI